MFNSSLLMQPPIMLRFVMSGVVACSLGAHSLRADDGTKVDAPKIELKPLIELKPAGASATNPLPGVSRPPTEFVPSVAVPSPEISRPTLPLLPKLTTEPVPLIDLRPKADLVQPVAPKLPELPTNPLDAAKPIDTPKPEVLPVAPVALPTTPLPPLNPLNPDVPATAAPGLTSRARVVLDVEPSGQTRVTVDGRELGSLQTLLGAERQASANDVTFAQKDARTVSISSRTREVIVEIAALPNWAARITANNSASFRVVPEKNYIDVLTPANLTESVIVRLPDGGAAELGADSAVRFDHLADKSYHVSGLGTVKAQTAEGQTVMLSHQHSLTSPTVLPHTLARTITESPRQPLPGGTQMATRDLAGNLLAAKVSPATEVAISGAFASGVNVRIGDRTVELTAAKPSEVVTLPNGSAIEFTVDSSREILTWRVHKGYFALTMDPAASHAFRLWRAYGLTDQSGTLQWDKTLLPHTLVLKNTTPGGPLHANSVIMVDLAKEVPPYNRYFDSAQAGFYAAVKPSATFSYSPSQTPTDELGNYNLRVGASAPEGGVNIFRVIPGEEGNARGTSEGGYNKEFLIGTDCFCMEAKIVGSASRGVLAPGGGGTPNSPFLSQVPSSFSLPPGKLGKTKVVPLAASP